MHWSLPQGGDLPQVPPGLGTPAGKLPEQDEPDGPIDPSYSGSGFEETRVLEFL